jgi:hypothetical protein
MSYRPMRNTVIRDGMVVRAVTNPNTRVGFARSEDRTRWNMRSGSPLLPLILMSIVAVAMLAGLWFAVRQAQRVTVTVTGLDDGSYRRPGDLAAKPVWIDVEGGELDRARLTLDGIERDDYLVAGERITWIGDGLPDGEHTLAVSVPRKLWGRWESEWTFVVDGEPPLLELPAPVASAIDNPVMLRGRVEPGAELTFDGDPVTPSSDGSFVVELDEPPLEPFELAAVDRAGNVTTVETAVPIAYPPTRAVHVSAAAWADPKLKAGVMSLIDEGLINTVELDLKDESGEIGFDSSNELGHTIGATGRYYALRDAVRELHDKGVRVIGRIVAFRDPILVRWAWNNDERDWVVQTADGKAPLSRDGGFTNYANPEVREYLLSLAVEAASMGIDDILWDYIRRPDGEPDKMRVVGRGTTPSADFIASFLKEGRERLRPYGVYQGASVFGIAATRPDQIAQDIPAMAANSDYIAPMLYPSHWGRGEYGVDHPEAQPGEIVTESLLDFQTAVEGKGAALVPWLQDFTLRVPYGTTEVQAQIEAVEAAGVHGFLLWDPHVTYNVDALR